MALGGEKMVLGGSGVVGLDFHFPFGSDLGIPLPEAGLWFLLLS